MKKLTKNEIEKLYSVKNLVIKFLQVLGGILVIILGIFVILPQI